MSSWTDTRPPTFAPYVQQQPVEAMVKVGTELQRRYDEGVGRIQANIDRVAGLDIERGVDREYLESKLNQLGDDLKTVAAGDFSNYQLVSSVSGMASRVAKDPNIINSVKSTAWYRKQTEQMQKDGEEGNYNPANVWDFSTKAQEWLNSNTPGESFGQTYRTPVDVWDKMKDIADQVGIDSQQLQQLYKTDEYGRIMRDEDGNAQWNYVMAEKILKGKDAGKILKAFNNALSPADFQQLSIEGRYKMRNYTPEMLEQEFTANSQRQIELTDSKIRELKTEIYKEEGKNKKNQNRIDSLKSQLEHFQGLSENIKSSVEREINAIRENPDGAKAAMYTNNYLTNMADVLSSQEVATKYSVNPMFEIMMSYNKLKSSQEGDKARAEDMAYTGEVKIAIDSDDALEFGEHYEENYRNGVDRLNRINYEVALESYKKTNNRRPGESMSEFDQRMRRKLDGDSGGNLTEHATKVAAKQIDDWNKSGNVPLNWKNLLDAQDNLSKTLEFQKSVMEDVEVEARARAETQGLNVPSDEQLKEQVGGMTIGLGDNPYGVAGEVRLSAQDVIDFARVHPGLYHTFGFLGTSEKEKGKAEEAKQRLREKFPGEYEALEHELFGVRGPVAGMKITPSMRSIHPALRGVINTLGSSAYKEFNKIKAEVYKDKGVIQQAVARPVLRNKTNIDDVKSAISNVIAKYPKGGMDKVDQEDLQKALLSDDDNAVRIISYPGDPGLSEDTHVLAIKTSDGDEVSVKIDSDDYRAIMRSDPPANRRRPAVTGMLDMKGTTNRLGVESPDGSWFGHDDFVNFDMEGYTLTGDMIQDMYDGDIAWMRLYLRDNDTGEYEKFMFPGDKTNFRLRKYNKDGSYNINLPHSPQGIDNTVIEQLRELQ